MDRGLHPVGTILDSKDGLARPTRIAGCSHGWVVTVDEACGLSLLEPLTGRRFPLPPITSSRCRCKKVLKDLELMGQGMFQKAALAPGRRLGTFAVMLIHSGGHGLSFLAPGSKSWTTLRAPTCSTPKKYMDVIFHKGSFYTLSVDSELKGWVPDGSSTGVRARLVMDPREEQSCAALVESTLDDLLMVRKVKIIDRWGSARRSFEVSRYDEQESRWIPAKNYGDVKIFVGGPSSFCVSRRGCLPTAMATEKWDEHISYSDSWDKRSASFLPYVAPEFPHY